MKILRSGIFVALWLALVGVASAQETTGTLIGRLQDSQGLALPGVTITVTGPQGVKAAISDADGTFRVPFLTPGSYDVRAELQGFKAVEQKAVSGQPRPDHRRHPAAGGGRPHGGGRGHRHRAVVDTTSTTTGAVLAQRPAQKRARRPPLHRHALPGARRQQSAARPARANPSMSGGSGLDNNYVVDGVNITNTGYGAVGSYSIVFGSLGTGVTIDFIQETQVKTGGFEAEYGQSTGGVVNVVTKSGTNNLHGRCSATSARRRSRATGRSCRPPTAR